MRLVEHRMLVAANLLTPEGWREHLDLDNLAGLRGELQAGRKLPPVQVVEVGGRYELVKGFHRLAAYLAEDIEDIRADVVEYDSPDEQRRDVLAENLRRRQVSTEEYRAGLRELVALFEASPEDRAAIEDQLDAEMDGPPGEEAEGFSASSDQPPEAQPSKGGRPKSPRRQAIKKAAKATGLNESTVERAVNPSKREPPDEPEAPVPTELPPALDWWDLEPDRDVDGQARKVQAQVAEIDSALRAVKRLLTGLRDLGHPNAVCDQLEADYDKLAHGARRQKPVASCPACKGFKVLRKDCFDCQGTGYASKALLDSDLPADLKERGERAMVRNGRGGFRGLPNASVTAPADANGNPVLTAEEAAEKFGGSADADETPPGDPSSPYEPKPGELIELRWLGTGETKRARFVKFTKRGSVVANIARVNAKGKYTGEFGSEARTFDRSELMGPAQGEGLPF